jgi:hypothetical protein
MARFTPPLTYGREETYDQKYERYKKYQEILFPRHHHKRCPTCYVVIHNRAGRCKWCKQALEAVKEGNKTFKECRAVLETLKREIERTDEKNIDITLAVMQAKVMIEYRKKFVFGLGSYEKPEINLGSLKAYRTIASSDYQKNERFRRSLDLRTSQFCLKDSKTPRKGQRKAPRTISEHLAIAMRDEKLAKKEERRLADRLHSYARDDKGQGSRGDKESSSRQDFYSTRITKPKDIGRRDFTKWVEGSI